MPVHVFLRSRLYFFQKESNFALFYQRLIQFIWDYFCFSNSQNLKGVSSVRNAFHNQTTTSMKRATTALLLIALTIGAITAQAQSTKDIKKLKKIAEKGHPETQYTLGVLYQHGDGDLVPEDPEQAIH